MRKRAARAKAALKRKQHADAKTADAEAGAADVDAEATEIDGAKAYIGGQLTRDTHKDLKTDKVVGAIHANVKSFDPRAEFFFRYVQVFTAMVDSFAPVWKSNSSAPRRRTTSIT